MSGPRTTAVVLAFLIAGTGCTLEQARTFIVWHETDPAGAEAWLATDDAQQFMDDIEPPHAVHVSTSPKWDAIAMCESGGNWSHPPVTNRTGTYSGGLMFRFNVWIAYGGQQFAPQAWQASKAQQIIVAERILADVGWSAWDCA